MIHTYYENVCNSCTIYIVLFVTFFTISINNNSVNPLYLITGEEDGYIEEKKHK